MIVITRITAVQEGSCTGEGYMPSEDATIYGMGNDQKMYYWGRTKSTRIEHEPDEEGNQYHYEHEWGWKPYEP
jgi:hypothetical protein